MRCSLPHEASLERLSEHRATGKTGTTLVGLGPGTAPPGGLPTTSPQAAGAATVPTSAPAEQPR